jgi:hypothetical protein
VRVGEYQPTSTRRVFTLPETSRVLSCMLAQRLFQASSLRKGFNFRGQKSASGVRGVLYGVDK